MTNALAERTELPTLPKEQIDLIRRTVANGATDTELQLFLYDCARRGIHPLDKLLHFTKRGNRYTPVTSIDFMRAQAAMSGEMAGSDEPVFTMDAERLVAATVTVYRLTQGHRFAYTATARWSEYCPDNAPMWKRMPHTMLGKCAEALALRKAFPQQLAGLYSREEMDQAENGKGYVVEAPAPRPAILSGERENLPALGRGDDAGCEPEVGAVVVPTSTASTDGPDMGVDLAENQVLILRVESGSGRTKAVAVAVDSEGVEASFNIYDDRLAELARTVCQEGKPVEIDFKTPDSGKAYLKSIKRVAVDMPRICTDPISDKDLPF